MKFQFDPLPKSFVLAKPIQWGEYDENEIYELEKNGRLIIEVKRDGWKLLDINANKQIKIYTDGPREITNRIPHIAEELRSRKLPNNTFLVSEGLIVANGKDERGKIQSVLHKDTSIEKSLLAQRIFKMRQMVFEIVFWDGQYLLDKPYAERLTLIQKFLDRDGYICPPEILNMPVDEAKKFVLKHNLEGLVLYDTEFRSSFRLDGDNPKRPDGCYKWKPMYEGDFIVRDLIPSKERPGDFKEILLLQIDPKTGKEIDCGKHGVFSKKDRKEIQALFRKNKPFVVQFEYETRTENNKLTNKRFVGIRHDKKWQDCVIPSKIFPKNMKGVSQ